MKLSDIIIYEDEDIVALNKPSGLLSIPDREGKEPSLKNLLQERYEQIFTIHRLDRETSGLILFAKNEAAHRHLSLQFEERKTEKIYLGLVLGQPVPASGTMDQPIAENMVNRGTMIIHRRGKPAVTDYETLETYGKYSWMQFRIHTGRTHQIRVHMKNLGHPIVCDVLYGDGNPLLLSSIKTRFKLSKQEIEERPLLNRLALHAHRLGFETAAGKYMELDAPLQKDLRATLQQLSKWKG